VKKANIVKLMSVLGLKRITLKKSF